MPGQPSVFRETFAWIRSPCLASWTRTLAPVDTAHVALPQAGFVTVTVTLGDGRKVTANGSFTITK